MKILITNTGPWGTGSFTVARALTEEYIKMGHQVKVFFPDAGLPSEELDYYYSNQDVWEIWKFPIEHNGTTLDSFPLIIPDPHPRNNVGTTFLELSDDQLNLYLSEFEREITQLIDTFQPDAIECQHIWAFDHVIEKLGYTYFCVAHHSDQLGFLYDQRMQPIAKQSAKQARKIFAISKRVHNEVVDLYGVTPEKVVITNNGYDRSVFRPFQIDREKLLEEFELDIPHDATIVTFAGKISKTKGIDTLLEANHLLQVKHNIHFLILGAGKLESVLDPAHLNRYCFDRVHFLGHQKAQTLAKLHNLADFCTMPSRSEGFGIACLEAMGCGLPVVVTRAGGPEEYAVGEIIEPEDPHALADALLKMSQLSNQEYEALQAQALEAAHKFSWETIARDRINHYKEAM